MNPQIPSYECKIGGQIFGPMPAAELRKIPGFVLRTPVALAGSQQWHPAFEVINLSDYFAPTHPPERTHELDAGFQEAIGMLADRAPKAAVPEVPKPQPAVAGEPGSQPRPPRKLPRHLLTGLAAGGIGLLLMAYAHRAAPPRSEPPATPVTLPEAPIAADDSTALLDPAPVAPPKIVHRTPSHPKHTHKKKRSRRERF